MTTFSSAAAMALEVEQLQTNMSLNNLPVYLQIPIKKRKGDVKGYTSKLMSELRKHKPDIQLHTVDETAFPDDAVIPDYRDTFDAYFKCTTRNNGNRQTCVLTIKASIILSRKLTHMSNLLRDNDITIMDIIGASDTSPKTQDISNNVRLWTGVHSLAEICTTDGTCITHNTWTGDRERFTNTLWPY